MEVGKTIGAGGVGGVGTSVGVGACGVGGVDTSLGVGADHSNPNHSISTRSFFSFAHHLQLPPPPHRRAQPPHNHRTSSEQSNQNQVISIEHNIIYTLFKF
ncbi:hypothetical protein QVD17_11804 [Tagetes erecta]|uniref:Uncharacterized protein n=1 Tax=Tagetes erecta TaxID=13708 RepID=A0AAD8KU46_TARER|nr:hypothetical protein QVD17_11804 [Tagetes erecta]